MYYVATFAVMALGGGLVVYGDYRRNEPMQVGGGVILLIFAVMLIGVWNLAANASGCCK